MKLKKLTALVLASMMIASTATAVPVSAAEDNEYSVFAILNGEYDLADNLTMQTTLEEAGLKFDFTSVMGADLAEKRNLLLASGDYPEIFMKSGFSMTDLNKIWKSGPLPSAGRSDQRARTESDQGSRRKRRMEISDLC